jgi:hypothetical protein
MLTTHIHSNRLFLKVGRWYGGMLSSVCTWLLKSFSLFDVSMVLSFLAYNVSKLCAIISSDRPNLKVGNPKYTQEILRLVVIANVMCPQAG